MKTKTDVSSAPASFNVMEVQITKNMVALPIWVGNDYACHVLQVTLRNLPEYRKRHGVPYYKHDRTISYRLDELLEFKSHHKIQ